MRPLDTDAAAEAQQLAAWRRLSGSARAGLALTMSDDLLALTRAGIRHRHPDWDDQQVTGELHRILGHDLAG